MDVFTSGYLPGDKCIIVVERLQLCQLQRVEAKVLNLVVVDHRRDDFEHHV